MLDVLRGRLCSQVGYTTCQRELPLDFSPTFDFGPSQRSEHMRELPPRRSVRHALKQWRSRSLVEQLRSHILFVHQNTPYISVAPINRLTFSTKGTFSLLTSHWLPLRWLERRSVTAGTTRSRSESSRTSLNLSRVHLGYVVVRYLSLSWVLFEQFHILNVLLRHGIFFCAKWCELLSWKW